MEMRRVILTEMGRKMNEVIERTGKEWMVVLGLDGETSAQMIDTVKDFFEKMWYVRSRNLSVYSRPNKWYRLTEIFVQKLDYGNPNKRNEISL